MVTVGLCSRCREPIDNEKDAYIIDDKGRMYHTVSVEYEQEILGIEIVGKRRIIKARMKMRRIGKDCYRK